MNTKTPIMILQEHMIKLGKGPPTYNHLDNQDNTFFQCRVQADGLNILGSGRNKKDAKQNAAMKALEVLRESGKYFPSPNVNINIKKDLCKDVENPHLNVTKLQDLCSEYQMPIPEYELLSETGPPHNKLFTMRCKAGSIERTAIASTKKMAKQMAAGNILEYYKDNAPERISDITDSNNDALVKLNDNAKQKYSELAKDSIPWRPNLGQIVYNYHCAFTNSLEQSKREELWCMLKARDTSSSSILFVEELFNKIPIEFEWSEVPAKQGNVAVFCARKANPPIYVMKQGQNAFDAKNKCADEVIEYINLML